MDRRKSYEKGILAELWVKWVRRFQGYRVLAHRYRTPYGEIDLVLKRGLRLYFVEVKTRDSFERGAESLRRAQVGRIRRSAEHFLKGSPLLSWDSLYFHYTFLVPRRGLLGWKMYTVPYDFSRI